MKKKKGFTLVELLAVIAILAILVIIALPNVLGMFNTAKKNSFTNELKIIISAAEKEFIKDTTFNNNGTGNIVYSRINKNYCNRKLDLSGRSNLDFYLELDNRGRVVRYFASDGTYQYASEKNDLKATDIKVEDVGEAGVDGEVLVITCDSVDFKEQNVLSKFIPGEELNIRMKTLAGNSNPTGSSVDTNITAIKRSTSEPSEANKQTINIVSTEDSTKPIYMWYQNGTIYYYSEEKPSLNQNSLGAFRYLTNLADISGLSDFDTSHVRNFERLFYACSSLTSLESIRNWNTSKVTNMLAMFGGAYDYLMQITDLTPLRNWNTSKVTTMAGMFQLNTKLTKLEGLENWDVSNVTNMRGMFLGEKSDEMHLNDITALRNWNTGKVTTMQGMFQENMDLESLEGLENWDVSNVTDMRGMFHGSDISLMHIKSLKPLAKWNTSKVIRMSAMFYRNVDLENLEGLENWNTANVEEFDAMFRHCSNLKIVNLSNFDFSKVKFIVDITDYGDDFDENGANMLKSVTNLEKVITPKAFTSDTRVYIELSKTMYDRDGNEYTKIDYTTPKNIELTSTRP